MTVLDNLENLLLGTWGQRKWLQEHEGEILEWLDDQRMLDEDDRTAEFGFFWQYPSIGMAIIKDSMRQNDEKQARFLDWLLNSSKICLMIGKRGSGKTAFGLWLLEQAHKRGMLCQTLQTNLRLPDWIERIEEPKDIANDAVVFFDEAQLKVSARESMMTKNRELGKWLSVSRHKSVSLLAATQHHALTDKYLMYFADGWVFRQLGYEELVERGRNRLIDTFMLFIERLKPLYPEQCLWTDGTDWSRIVTALPKLWTDAVSRGYKNLGHQEAVDFILKLHERRLPTKLILSELALRGRGDYTPFDVESIIKWPKEQKQGRTHLDEKEKRVTADLKR